MRLERHLPVAIAIATIVAAVGMLVLGSRSVPYLETTNVSQFRMGPIGLPVSQTINTGAVTLTKIELPLTSGAETPVPNCGTSMVEENGCARSRGIGTGSSRY